MIEKTVLDFLIMQDFEGVNGNVFLEAPERPPERYILVEKTGSGRENRIDNVSMAIQSISSKSLLEAAFINSMVKEAMEGMPYEMPGVYSCRLDTDYNFTNPATKQYRYQAVYNIFY